MRLEHQEKLFQMEEKEAAMAAQAEPAKEVKAKVEDTNKKVKVQDLA